MDGEKHRRQASGIIAGQLAQNRAPQRLPPEPYRNNFRVKWREAAAERVHTSLERKALSVSPVTAWLSALCSPAVVWSGWPDGVGNPLMVVGIGGGSCGA